MYPVYRGVPRQYGHGLGSLFHSAIKSTTPLLAPLVSSTMRAIKNEGVRQGTGAITDVLLKGKSPKQVLKTRGIQAIKSIGKAAALQLGRSLINRVRGGRRPRRATKRINKPTHKKTPHFTTKRRRSNPLQGIIRSKLLKTSSRPIDIFD